MPCLKGFKEKSDIVLLKEEYVKRKLFDKAVKHGYQNIVIPVIEKATSFSEEVVGHSPWPEWNEKGCFFFDIQNYSIANLTIMEKLNVCYLFRKELFL